MVRRNDKVAFMAGSYVFPGGRVDDSDRPLSNEPCRAAVFSDLSDAEESAYRTAAVRELQEEANVSISVDDLIPFAHWVTPEIETRRYDTLIFALSGAAATETVLSTCVPVNESIPLASP